MLSMRIAMLYVDLSLFLLRAMVAAVYGTSGFYHLKTPRQRAASLGMSVGFTVFLGAAELAGAIALVAGVLTQWAALGLILVALGAIFMKAVKWKTGFWGEKSMGWHYDLIFVVMNLAILCTGGGRIALMPM
jgi:putative oxidoreductase